MKLLYKIQFTIVYTSFHQKFITAKIQIFPWDFLPNRGFFSKYLINFADDFDCSFKYLGKNPKKGYNCKEAVQFKFCK